MKKLPTLFLLTFGLILVSCGGGSGGGHSPTAPRPVVVIGVNLVAATGGGAREITLSFDGREIDRHTVSSVEFGCAANCSLQARVNDVSSGSHTVTVTVVSQTSAVVGYAVVGQVSVISETGQRNIELPLRQVSLRAGEAVTYSTSI
jgi:hypothetical protein